MSFGQSCNVFCVKVCVCTVLMIACDVLGAFVLWAYTNDLFIVYDPYLSWLGDGVLVLAMVGVGRRTQKMALALSKARKSQMIRNLALSVYTYVGARPTHSFFVHHCAH